METRIQRINGDTMIEVSGPVVQKVRHSEKVLLRRQAYFEAMIAKGRAGLDAVNADLATIQNEREKSN